MLAALTIMIVIVFVMVMMVVSVMVVVMLLLLLVVIRIIKEQLTAFGCRVICVTIGTVQNSSAIKRICHIN